MFAGYMGKLLEVNLSNRTRRDVVLSCTDIQSYLGGFGLGAKILWESIPPGTNPLSEKNVLLFMTGPLTGTPSPCMRMCVVTKSPHTGTFSASYVGGHMGPEIKFAGYDGILVSGEADKPMYVVVTNNDVSFRDASSLWGKGIYETEIEIKNRHGKDYRVASIGPAAENLVSYASIGIDFFRHAGRGGVGTVMGQKKLKALAVKGTQDIRIKDLNDLYALSSKMCHTMSTSREFYVRRRWGTLNAVRVSSEGDTLPTHNFRAFFFENAEDISGPAAERSHWVKKMACFGCPLQCGNLAILRTGMYAGTVAKGPEYETAAMLGSNCGVNDLEGLIKLTNLCDDLGVDTVSMGSVIAFVLECFEKGILKPKNLDGLSLGWGDAKAIGELVKMTVYRRGFGQILAQGVKELAEYLGGESSKMAIHVKGLEIPGWAITPGMALSYATGIRGADHNDSYVSGFETKGLPAPDGIVYERDSYNKANLVKMTQDRTAAYNCLIACNFVWGGTTPPSSFLQLLKAATGLDIDLKTFFKIGERSWNLARLFNVREGFTSEEDTVPDRFFEEFCTLKDGRRKVLIREEFRRMLLEYYRLRGWNPKTGIAYEEKLGELGIEYGV